MPKKVFVSATEDELKAAQDRFEGDGFVFMGNGFLPGDSDSGEPVCPACGEGGFFYALWDHPTRKFTEKHGEETYSYPQTRSINRCYECGYNWIDEDDYPDQLEASGLA